MLALLLPHALHITSLLPPISATKTLFIVLLRYSLSACDELTSPLRVASGGVACRGSLTIGDVHEKHYISG